MNVGFTNSEENDYSAETFSFGVSQDIFGDLTTVSLGYSLGNDTVGRRGDANFSDTVERQQYRLGVSQILTKNLLLGLSFETITDEGFLNNPYRQVRYRDTTHAAGLQLRARDLSAHAHERRGLRSVALLLAVARGGPRRVPPVRRHVGHPAPDTFELGYTHPIEPGWTFEGKLRSYSQTKADFYSDLFPRSQFQNFIARDKELSTFTSQTLRLGASYDIVRGGWKFVERGTVNVILDHMMFDYEDFRDLARHAVRRPAREPLYTLRRERRPGLRLVLVLTSA